MAEILRSSQKHPTKLFYGPTCRLHFDPLRYRWPNGAPLLQFSTKEARSWMRDLDTPVNLCLTRWRGSLPRNTPVDWRDTWRSSRAQKEAAFLWSIWHKAIAVNEWRHKISHIIDTSCPFCPGHNESILHRFWGCELARSTWHSGVPP